MKKLIILVCCSVFMAGCCEKEIIYIAPEGKPELAKRPTEPPKGWKIKYNGKYYRWCFPSGYCPSFNDDFHNTKQEAIDAAWRQFAYGKEISDKEKGYKTLE